MVADDRGQLILVGAIAIALVLLGLVLIVNTALFTQVVGSQGTVETAKDGGVSGQELGNAIGDVVAEENRAGGPASVIDDRTRDSVADDLNIVLQNRAFESTGVFVNATYVGHTTEGTLIRQGGGDLSNSAGISSPWTPVTSSDVGKFLMTVDVAGSAGEEFTITVDNPTSTRSVTVDVDGTGDQVTVTGDVSGDCTGIDETGGTVRIDAYHGSVLERGDCRIDLFDTSADSYTIAFSDVSNVDVAYSIATSQDLSLSGPSEPTTWEIVWEFEYRYEYDSNAATIVSDDREVEVYD